MKQLEISHWQGPEPVGSSRQVYLGILQDLEAQRMVPGQRLVETELAARYGVGRNAVREAMQHLAVRGVIDLSPNRSPAIRALDLAEGLEVLDVAEAMLRLAARTAASHYTADCEPMLSGALADIERAFMTNDLGLFNRGRRHFYRGLLEIGGNRELQRLFPAIGMHILHVQYASPALQDIRRTDYRLIAEAVMAGDSKQAEAAALSHVDKVRAAIRAMAES
jgi:DNA-binding GntR family transcriptional regulator